MTGLFVTGTDTGVGKTVVTAALSRRLRERGLRVFAFKPIETGCTVDVRGERMGDDQRTLCAAAGGWQSGELAGLYRLLAAVAPSVAAEAERVTIDIDRVVEVARRGAGQADVTIVEGAGGWRAPLSRESDVSSLARALGWPVVVVARATLGTINHTVLTLEAAERDGCQIAGVVMSRRPEESLEFARSNAFQIEQTAGQPVTIFDGDARVLDVFHVEP
jgi:dethiobiotin synthetase